MLSKITVSALLCLMSLWGINAQADEAPKKPNEGVKTKEAAKADDGTNIELKGFVDWFSAEIFISVSDIATERKIFLNMKTDIPGMGNLAIVRLDFRAGAPIPTKFRFITADKTQIAMILPLSMYNDAVQILQLPIQKHLFTLNYDRDAVPNQDGFIDLKTFDIQ